MPRHLQISARISRAFPELLGTQSGSHKTVGRTPEEPGDTQKIRDRNSAIRGQICEDIRFRKVGNGPGGSKTLEGKGGPGLSFPSCKKSGSA